MSLIRSRPHQGQSEKKTRISIPLMHTVKPRLQKPGRNATKPQTRIALKLTSVSGWILTLLELPLHTGTRLVLLGFEGVGRFVLQLSDEWFVIHDIHLEGGCKKRKSNLNQFHRPEKSGGHADTSYLIYHY